MNRTRWKIMAGGLALSLGGLAAVASGPTRNGNVSNTASPRQANRAPLEPPVIIPPPKPSDLPRAVPATVPGPLQIPTLQEPAVPTPAVPPATIASPADLSAPVAGLALPLPAPVAGPETAPAPRVKAERVTELTLPVTLSDPIAPATPKVIPTGGEIVPVVAPEPQATPAVVPVPQPVAPKPLTPQPVEVRPTPAVDLLAPPVATALPPQQAVAPPVPTPAATQPVPVAPPAPAVPPAPALAVPSPRVEAQPQLTPPAPSQPVQAADTQPSLASQPVVTEKKLKVMLHMGDEQPRFEVRDGEDVLLKVTCEKVDVKSPSERGETMSVLKATGKVTFMTPGGEGICDELTVAPGTGQVCVSGKVNFKYNWGKVETTVSGDKMTFRLGSAPGTVVGPGSARTEGIPASYQRVR
ncbi:hypothetical protein [Fimbriiglobus ruber]|uniref:Uncharacterized protein n=1 Tax=Fimbriiglobus ruber TaxID=1908690 RepID=A0A225DFZ5_9BACT|nr:hypothetical protein [Fimbriiglobus ruber]OWK40491.1 hypothetical protein FRUB_05410 [Fimbriiglobus ruber]